MTIEVFQIFGIRKFKDSWSVEVRQVFVLIKIQLPVMSASIRSLFPSITREGYVNSQEIEVQDLTEPTRGTEDEIETEEEPKAGSEESWTDTGDSLARRLSDDNHRTAVTTTTIKTAK